LNGVPEALFVTDPRGQGTFGSAGLRHGVRFEDRAHATLPGGGSTLPAALVQFTSGSPGEPRGVLLTQANLQANLRQSWEFLEGLADRPVFCPLPQVHATGLAVTLAPLSFGSPVHFANRFDPASHLRRMRESRCAALVTGPDYLRLLLRLALLQPERLPDLTDIEIGTALAPMSLLKDLRAALPKVRLHLRYGLSEAAGALTRLTIDPRQALPGSGEIGVALPGVELRTVAGELQARAGSCATQWISGPSGLRPLLDDLGFLPTGDQAKIDGAGVVRLLGRNANFVKVHGHRVDPVEVEELLREFSSIAAVAVLGIPDPIAGQSIVAFLEPVAGKTPPGAVELSAACDRGLSPFKRPARFVIVPSLPRTSSGKPDLLALRRLLRGEAAPGP
jgi:acyl-CoA synthetase (AMP-forming)/AMP-acid ligase II